MKVIVIGGGTSGLMASVSAAMHGAEVVLLEKNPTLGKNYCTQEAHVVMLPIDVLLRKS
jgi:pyridine nucleotide-disulfide oxidoreductase